MKTISYKSLYKHQQSISLIKSSQYKIHNIIKSTSLSQIKSPIFIDPRSKQDYEKGHIKDARNIPEFFTYLSMTSNIGISNLVSTFKGLLRSKGISNYDNLVFYEDYLGSLKGVSCRGSYLMNLFGYDNKKVFILSDGLDGVVKTNPELVEKGKEKEYKEGSFEIDKLNYNEFIGYQALYDQIRSNKSPVILDVRDNEEWVGLSSSPYGPDFTPRKGRISKSKHLLWTDLMKDSKDFREDKEIETIMKGLGIENKDEELVVYCFKGCRSSNSLVALKKAGYKNTKNYLGSWNEWSRILELPIDDKVLK